MKLIKVKCKDAVDDIKDKMREDYEDLIRRMKNGEVLSKQDHKFIQSYQSINKRSAFNAGKRADPNNRKQRVSR